MRLLTTGFEENDITSTQCYISASGSVSVTTTNPHTGTYALRITGAANNPFLQLQVKKAGDGIFSTSPDSTTGYLRFWYRFPTLPAANTDIMCATNGGGGNSTRVILLTTGKLRIKNDVTGTTADSSSTLSTNTYYCIELRNTLHDTAGTIELKVAGTLEATISGENTNNTGWIYIMVGSYLGPTNSHDGFYDNIALNDGSGSFQNSYPGLGRLVLVKPASDDTVAWTKNTGASNAAAVDDVPGAPDDATTYTEDSGSTNADRLNHSGCGSGVDAADTMVLMHVMGKAYAGAVSQTAQFLVWDNSGTNTTGPSIALTNATWSYPTYDETYVVSLSGKTKANTDAYDIGYKGLTGSSAKRFTAVWAYVEFLSGGGGGGGGSVLPVIEASYRRRRR